MKKYLIIPAILLTLVSCVKPTKNEQYPEDPGPSDLSAHERLSNRVWTLKSVTLNGKELIDTVHKKSGSLMLKLENTKVNAPYAPESALRGHVTTDTFGTEFMVWDIGAEAVWSHIITSSGTIGGSLHYQFLMFPNVSNFGSSQAERIFVKKLTTTEFKISATTASGDTTVVNYFQSL